MSIKIKEVFHIEEGQMSEADEDKIFDQIEQLLPGDYSIFICDSKKNRSLSQLKYLFGVVLKIVSKETGETVNNLYRIFEKMFAPRKTVVLKGEEYIVQDLKNSTSKEMGLVIEQIIDYVETELNTKIPDQDQVRESIAQDIYIDAYNDDWFDKTMKKRSK